MDCVRPTDVAELAEAIADAASTARPFEVLGGGSKRGLGRPVEAIGLDCARLTGLVDYAPGELVLTARPGLPLAEAEELLARHRQMFAFEPVDLRPLLGAGCGGAPTLGGMIGCNLAGPRRVRAGSVRDSLLGVAAVNGRGEPYRAGGRVVKNVTGYDICKLHAGAMGTLSVLTEVSLRTVPLPETEASLVVPGLEPDAAVRLMAEALNSPNEVAAAAHLPTADGQQARTVLRLEGPGPSVLARADALAPLSPGASERLDAASSRTLWREIGEVRPLSAEALPGTALWRICVAPATVASLLAALLAERPEARWLLDWGGGLLWLAVDEEGDAAAATVRRLVGEAGHATLVRADAATRARVPVFQPLSTVHRGLLDRLKQGFDPAGVLNPHRLHAPG